ncbi:DUF397 domain-containing protein [Streptomonospora litoralis]|uniref:DUF397 domain-containing protein n=1 Tax=Streptomonospora litoralis TaxID=2498135 RepID=A0A4P6PZN6_9ACTN|nr:DUF397 domain-containing protein [Streptomonospora litoralis]QBI53665.1 hypothetical protein EKD16_09355 [Streptomonospora litoralis]
MNENPAVWHKSSYSGGSTGNCMEVGWHKSSYSNGGANCVEVATSQPAILVRDTQHRPLGHLDFPADEWTAFLHAAKAADL